MTTKFSKNRAKVQPTPKVCKSEKKERAGIVPPTYPPSVKLNLNWNLSTSGMPPAFSTYGALTQLNQLSGGNYTVTTVDGQGRSTQIDFTIAVGSPSTGAIKITGFGNAGNDADGSGPTWDGSNPFGPLPTTWTPSAGIGGTITGTMQIP